MALKKVIGMLGAIGITAIGSSSVVSCVAPKYADGIDGQRVALVTYGSVVNDHSFNQDAMLGIKNFKHDVYNESSTNSYVEAGNSNPQAVISAYKLALLKGANTLVVPGFQHLQTLPQSLSFMDKQNIIFVDSVLNAPNVVSVLFNSQISGLMAGFDSSYWATTINPQTGKMNGDINSDGKITIGTFIGGSNKSATDNYVWGLMLGMSVFNEMAKDLNRPKVYFANSSTLDIKDFRVNSSSDSVLYTNSFALGAATQSGIISRLVDSQKADIIFPVAGSQIEDVINYKTPVYLIGVDVDQAGSYPMAAKQHRFITSAVKNINAAVPAALIRAESDTRANTLIDPTTNKPFSAGKGLNKNFTQKDKWLGTSPDPLLNWSVDQTQQNNSDYLLSQNYLKLYDASQANNEASTNTAIYDINNYYNSLGNSVTTYMAGNTIVSFANELVQKYGHTINSNGAIDWTETRTS